MEGKQKCVPPHIMWINVRAVAVTYCKVSSFPFGLGTLVSGIILLNCVAYPSPYLLYDE